MKGHRLSSHPLYSIWSIMNSRCYNKNTYLHNCYGGRGITVCKEWRINPKAFIDWAIQNGYEKGLTIDRINNDGNYEPSNCRFISHAENCRNSRQTKLDWESVAEIRNIKLLIPGITLKEIAQAYSVTSSAIGNVIHYKTLQNPITNL